MKTVSVALILCLNVEVDPPDVLRIAPCARAECWVNPLVGPPAKALDAIGKALQAQYERWQPRARYKAALDPTVEEVRRLCLSCRRNAKGERVLLHYNGHGVPRPTANGEVWVFNKSYTQYIPLSIFDLHAWTGAPAIYVLDCSGAGHILNVFAAAGPDVLHPPPPPLPSQPEQGNRLGSMLGPPGSTDAQTRGSSGRGGNAAAALLGIPSSVGEGGEGGAGGAAASPSSREVIFLASCAAHELLPCSPELPADVFTACLTSPIKMALRWFCLRSPLRHEAGLSPELAELIPGQQNNRKTPLGELNWIFTAITDTIAWNVLPRPLFQRLFRQDLLLASLFRNFLLAERVMRALNCTPHTSPALPSTSGHPMWAAWDYALEACLLQLPGLLAAEAAGETPPDFVPSSFFSDQLTAFEVWLEHGGCPPADPPEQLPIVLQVLLSQSHRLRALMLLGRFLDKGPWAVQLALSVGIFPYVLKLLQTTAADLRYILVFIWTKLLAVDRSCQADLVKDSAHLYFIRFLDSPSGCGVTGSPQGSQGSLMGGSANAGGGGGLTCVRERTLAAFCLSAICEGHPRGQALCFSAGLSTLCLAAVPAAASQPGSSSHELLLKWLVLCLAKLWAGQPAAQAHAFEANAPGTLQPLLQHPHPEVRAATCAALAALIALPPVPITPSAPGSPSATSAAVDATAEGGGPSSSASDDAAAALAALQQALLPEAVRHPMERSVASMLIPAALDASPLVRLEVSAALSLLAAAHPTLFHSAALSWQRASATAGASGAAGSSGGGGSSLGGGPLRPRQSSLDGLPEGSPLTLSAALGGSSGNLFSIRPPGSYLPAYGRSRLSSLSSGAGGSSFFAASEAQLGSMSMGDFAAYQLGGGSAPPSPSKLSPQHPHHRQQQNVELPEGASVVVEPSTEEGGSPPDAQPLAFLHPQQPQSSGGDTYAGVAVFADPSSGAFLYSPSPAISIASAAAAAATDLFSGPSRGGSSNNLASMAGGSPSSGGGSPAPPALFATADAARLGGGLYSHLLATLLSLATDPSPRVSVPSRSALAALGVEKLAPPPPPSTATPPIAPPSPPNGKSRLSRSSSGSAFDRLPSLNDWTRTTSLERQSSGGSAAALAAAAAVAAAEGDGGMGRRPTDRDDPSWKKRISSYFSPGKGLLPPGPSTSAGASSAGGGNGTPSRLPSFGSRSGGAEGGRGDAPRLSAFGSPASESGGWSFSRRSGNSAAAAAAAAVASAEQSTFFANSSFATPSPPPPALPTSLVFDCCARHFSRPLLAPGGGGAMAGEDDEMDAGGMDDEEEEEGEVALEVQAQAAELERILAAEGGGSHRGRHSRSASLADLETAALSAGDITPRTRTLLLPRMQAAQRSERASAASARALRTSRGPPLRCTELLASAPGESEGGETGEFSNTVTVLCCHPLRPQVVYGDAQGVVRVWTRPRGSDEEESSVGGGKAGAGSVAKVRGTGGPGGRGQRPQPPVAALYLLNALEASEALLCSCSADGTVRVWSGWQGGEGRSASSSPPQLVTAWRALPSLPTPSSFAPARTSPTSSLTPGGGVAGSAPGASLRRAAVLSGNAFPPIPAFSFTSNSPSPPTQPAASFCMQASEGRLFCGAEGGVHAWDLGSESLVDCVPVSTLATGAYLSHLCPSAAGHFLVGGASDGRLLAFDLRLPASLIASTRLLSTPCRGLLLAPGGQQHTVVAAGAGGELVWTDLRRLGEPPGESGLAPATARVQAHQRSVDALAGHPAGSGIASGSHSRTIRLYDLQAQPLGAVKYAMAFLGQRIQPVTALAFSPTLPLLAAGLADGGVSLYGLGKEK